MAFVALVQILELSTLRGASNLHSAARHHEAWPLVRRAYRLKNLRISHVLFRSPHGMLFGHEIQRGFIFSLVWPT
jgi:hypothetical protein